MRRHIFTITLLAACGGTFEPDLTDLTEGSDDGETLTMTDDSTGDGSGTGSTDTDDTGDGTDSTTGDELPCGVDPEGICPPCEVPTHEPCDVNAGDPASALGVDCDGEIGASVDVSGSPSGWTTLEGLQHWQPTEGTRLLVIGSGNVAELGFAPAAGTCNDDLGAYDPVTPPDPIHMMDAGDCEANQTLVGTGDCSNTLEDQFLAGVYDYTEVRLELELPDTIDSFSFDWAFLSAAYPQDFQSQCNDIFITWVESAVWSGNGVFTEQGDAVALNTVWPDYEGAAPELEGTCMEGHGATDWRTATVPVPPGDTITIVFAVMDMCDSIRDTFVLLDNFRWGCDG